MLWLAPAASAELLERQACICGLRSGTELHPHYRPGAWAPHLTLANDLTSDGAAEALRLCSSGWTPFAPHGWLSVGTAAATLMFSFAGWEAVAPLTTRFKDPARQLPRAVAIALAATTVLYLGLAMATISVLGPRAATDVPLAGLLSATASGALAQQPPLRWDPGAAVVVVLAAFAGPLFIDIMVPALFLLCSVGIVAMYADDIRVSRLRRNGLQPPDDPDLGRPSH